MFMGKSYDLTQCQVAIKKKRSGEIYQLSIHSGCLDIEPKRYEIGQPDITGNSCMTSLLDDVEITIKIDDYADFKDWLSRNHCNNYIIQFTVDMTNGIDEIEIGEPAYHKNGVWKFYANKNSIPPALYS